MGDCFGQHGFAAPWGAVHEHASWGVYTDLFVELEVGEGQLYGFSHLLLLNVHTTFEGGYSYETCQSCTVMSFPSLVPFSTYYS